MSNGLRRTISKEKEEELYNNIKQKYDDQTSPYYAAARLWVDEIIEPKDTRTILIKSLNIVNNSNQNKRANYGVFQV